MFLSKCAVWDSKKLKFIKEQEASELLGSLGIETPLREIPLVGPLLFQRDKQVNTRYKMNEIINKLLLAEDKYISLKKQKIHAIFIKKNQVKLAFNMIWPMEILKI